MAIAQMNWGRLRHALDHPNMAEFNAALDVVYGMAETHRGFIWRIPDARAEEQLAALGYDNRMSATVSVWETVEDLRAFTYKSDHAAYLAQKAKWFAPPAPPQLVLWDVPRDSQPSFAEAFRRLEMLKRNGPTADAYGWPDRTA